MMFKLLRKYCHTKMTTVKPNETASNCGINWFASKLKHTATASSTNARLKYVKFKTARYSLTTPAISKMKPRNFNSINFSAIKRPVTAASKIKS